MTYKNISNVSFFLLTLLIGSSVLAREVTVNFAQFQPPYVMYQQHTNGKNMHGIEVEIFKETLALIGHTLVAKDADKAEIKWLLRTNNKIDATSAVRLSTDRFYYSDVLIEHQPLAFSKEKNNIILNSVGDLKDYKVGASLKHELSTPNHNSDRLYSSKGSNHLNSQVQQNIDFWSDQIDIIIIDRYIFEYYKKMLANEFDTLSQKIRSHALFAKKVPLYAAFKDEQLKNEFNKALSELKNNGRYQAIIDEHTKRQ